MVHRPRVDNPLFQMYIVVTLPVKDSVAVVHSSWLADGERFWWPRTTTFAHHQQLSVHGDGLPNDTLIYDITGV